MFDSKYGKVLTILLIIAIVAIIGLLIFFGYEKFQKSKNDKEAIAAIEEFDRNHGVTNESTPKPEETTSPDIEEIPEIPEITPSGTDSSNGSGNTTSNGSSTNNSGTSDGKTYYKGFVMVGHINIPKTNVKLPILDKVTKKSLETSVVILYPLNAKLNEPGNVVIAGHNYRNSLFFSNNKNLKEGDKIYITDESGRKLTYVVYSNFQTTAEDTSFYTRDTGGVPEITLTTCVQTDSTKRTIVLARAE